MVWRFNALSVAARSLRTIFVANGRVVAICVPRGQTGPVPVLNAHRQSAGADRNFVMERGAAELRLQVRLSKCRCAPGYWRFAPATPEGAPNAAA